MYYIYMSTFFIREELPLSLTFFKITIMSSLYNPTIEAWLLGYTEVSLRSTVRLSGLYNSFDDYCQLQGVPPVGVKEFSRGVEFLMARHFQILSPKARDQRGVVFKGIQLKIQKQGPKIDKNQT